MAKRAENTDGVLAKLSALYDKLTDEQKLEFCSNLTLREYKRNETLYREGDEPEVLFCLIQGKVKVFKEGVGGRSQTMRLYKPVEYFGYRAYVSGQKLLTSASAIEHSLVAQIPLPMLNDFVRSNNALAYFVIQTLANLLGQSDERTVSLTQKHIRGRLAESLLFLRDSYGVEEDGCTLSLYLSREDLANLSNMTTANAIRTLSAFAAERLVAIDGKKIKLINETELEKISRLG